MYLLTAGAKYYNNELSQNANIKIKAVLCSETNKCFISILTIYVHSYRAAVITLMLAITN